MPSNRRQKARNGYGNDYSVLDGLDLQLLAKLRDTPRISMSDLAKAVRLSRPAVVERVRNLERDGVISGWRVEIDPAKLGLPLSAYIRVRPLQGRLSTVANLAKATPQVVECHRITGEDCFLMKVDFASVKALEQIIDRFLLYGQTTTSIVQSSPVPLRSPPLPE